MCPLRGDKSVNTPEIVCTAEKCRKLQPMAHLKLDSTIPICVYLRLGYIHATFCTKRHQVSIHRKSIQL